MAPTVFELDLGMFLQIKTIKKYKTTENRLKTKKLAHSNEWILRKMQNPPCLDIWNQKGKVWTVYGKIGKNYPKSTWNIFFAFLSSN